jgi:hypothetical protein
MKRLILILGFVLFSTLVFANDGVKKTFKENTGGTDFASFGVVCIDGYKFAFMKTTGNNGVALVQIFGDAWGGTNQAPVECKK